MKKDQKEIYYATGDSIENIKELPQMEKILDKGYEVLYFLDQVDEFLAAIINSYQDKTFKSLQKGDLDLDSEEEKAEIEKKTTDNKSLLDSIKDNLKEQVIDVKLSNRLKSHPVCLVSDDALSIDMEKALNAINPGGVKANKILEINPDHELFLALSKAYEKDPDIANYAQLLYDQALLIAGLPIEDPVKYSERVSDLMLKALK